MMILSWSTFKASKLASLSRTVLLGFLSPHLEDVPVPSDSGWTRPEGVEEATPKRGGANETFSIGKVGNVSKGVDSFSIFFKRGLFGMFGSKRKREGMLAPHFAGSF